MGASSPLRLALDVAFAAAILVCGWVCVFADGRPAFPSGVCEDTSGSPRYDALGGELTIVAVFGQIRRGVPLRDDDPAWRSIHRLERELRARGFAETAGVWRRGRVVLEITGPLTHDPVAIDAVLDAGIATHDITYYNGHEYGGSLTPSAPRDGYRIVVLDSCWSTQHYARHLLQPNVDVVGNTERAVTGSVASFVVFLDGIQARASWRELLEPMNELAVQRVALRRDVLSEYDDAEHYRHDVACR